MAKRACPHCNEVAEFPFTGTPPVDCPKCGKPFLSKAQRRQGFGCLAAFAVFFLGALYIMYGRAAPTTRVTPIETAQRPVAPTVAPETAETVRMLRTYFPLARRAHEAARASTKCQYDAVGFQPVFACAEAQAAFAAAARAEMPAAAAQTQCGRSIEAPLRATVADSARFLEDTVAYLNANAAALRATLHGKHLATSKGKIEQGVPREELYEGTGFANVMQVECTKTLFQCGAVGNVCFVNKVAARLGLAGEENCITDTAGCRLVERASGIRIRP
jgi:hypothetical protein